MPYEPPSYREYMQAVQAAGDAVSENRSLHQRIGELERRLAAAELTPLQIYDLATAELEELAPHHHHHHRLVTHIVVDLRKRHRDVAQELVAPQLVRLETELAQMKERVWQARSEAHELRQENSRLMATLEKLADVHPEHEQAPLRGGAA